MDRLRLASATGGATSLLAIAASSCCALPAALALVAGGGTVAGLLRPLQPLRPAIIVVAAVLLALAWLIAVRRRAKGATFWLAVSTAALVLAILSPAWDPAMQRAIKGNGPAVAHSHGAPP